MRTIDIEPPKYNTCISLRQPLPVSIDITGWKTVDLTSLKASSCNYTVFATIDGESHKRRHSIICTAFLSLKITPNYM
ncbi:hypothetical protein TWF225_009431 [Orbilia oligospora]|uniref:Uncharacterized protein n=1 Tax=Orbilia oligospora TaxID=2813651 RepID=A0A7C8KCH0_ORBOL|nr:hypothetical protein TWF751_007536 [Orbilia oligospora]KAF3174709.1 hypothetical protein TWF225_009431 [Orbilia oligospora]KAF3259415.1 hypothetical protein TWF217_005113 [Orbilia oligospora]KAF3263897.1 hypothetical protein TWF128_001533 [Orbilia oligospora]KAF3290196.1 hypothetical protein TWF132_007195 [Orbilia oligospora]